MSFNRQALLESTTEAIDVLVNERTDWCAEKREENQEKLVNIREKANTIRDTLLILVDEMDMDRKQGMVFTRERYREVVEGSPIEKFGLLSAFTGKYELEQLDEPPTTPLDRQIEQFKQLKKLLELSTQDTISPTYLNKFYKGPLPL